MTNLNVLIVGHTTCATDIQQAFTLHTVSSLAECQSVVNWIFSRQLCPTGRYRRRHVLIDCWRLASQHHSHLQASTSCQMIPTLPVFPALPRNVLARKALDSAETVFTMNEDSALPTTATVVLARVHPGICEVGSERHRVSISRCTETKLGVRFNHI